MEFPKIHLCMSGRGSLWSCLSADSVACFVPFYNRYLALLRTFLSQTSALDHCTRTYSAHLSTYPRKRRPVCSSIHVDPYYRKSTISSLLLTSRISVENVAGIFLTLFSLFWASVQFASPPKRYIATSATGLLRFPRAVAPPAASLNASTKAAWILSECSA